MIKTDPENAEGAFSIDNNQFVWGDIEPSFYTLRTNEVYQLDVTVTICALAGLEPFTISDEKQMVVTLLDPCVIPEYVNVYNSNSPSYSSEFDYTIGNGDLPVYYGRFIFIT